MADSVYCYPGTNVLKNKLGIQDADELSQMERKLTALRLLELVNKPIMGNFDLQHLQDIHWYIFQDIYEWAGAIRKTDLAKENIFCKVEFLYEQAGHIFGNLKKDHYLQNMTKMQLSKKMAYYFSEINALHPFREGNGRSQREFIRSLALRNGYRIYFTNITPEEMMEASKASFLCNYHPMEQLFDKCLHPGGVL